MSSLASLPSVDTILNHPNFAGYKRLLLKKRAQEVLASIRESRPALVPPLREILAQIEHAYHNVPCTVVPLINATGILIHTNLGRSPISRAIYDRAAELICGYNNVEFELQSGKRGERYIGVARCLRELLGCEDCLVVNNNAAALFLILNTFAKEREVIVSRGELIEIGGGFRIPEVMANSGAKLHEIGTTNKTKLADYRNAINAQTAMILKVHRSNYAIEGFTQSVELPELIALARDSQLLDCYDLGGGLLRRAFGAKQKELANLRLEPALDEILPLHPSLVCFSGDKLLGSVQAGIILGKASLITQLKTNQLLRMLRVDKITLILLEHCLQAYLDEDYDSIPLLAMLQTSLEELHERAQSLKAQIPNGFDAQICPTTAYIGGGTLPQKGIVSIGIALSHDKLDCESLKDILRTHRIITRIHDSRVLFDMRTLFVHDLEHVSEALKEIAQCNA